MYPPKTANGRISRIAVSAVLTLTTFALLLVPLPTETAAAQGAACTSGLTSTAAGCSAEFTTIDACPAGFDPAQANDGNCRVTDSAALGLDDGAAYCASLTATHPGTSGDDTILGTPGNDIIKSLGGNDVIAGGGGDDIICAGDGDDTVWGQAGNDKIFGQAGNDKLRGGDDNDILRGSVGDDDLNGGRGNDAVDGGTGNDPKVRGGTGDDWVSGGDGADPIVSGNGGRDSVHGGSGNDKVIGGPRPDILRGGPDNDLVRGLSGADQLHGDTGDDSVFGGAQNDNLDGGAGTDACNGGLGADMAIACETEVGIEDGGTPPSGVAPPPTFSIDPALEPAATDLRQIGGQDRPVAALRGPNGEIATFVANELVVNTDDPAELDRILAAVGGEIIEQIVPEGVDLANIYLIRVNTALGDPAALPGLLTQLDDAAGVTATGAHTFSSNQGAALMAIVGTQAVSGVLAGVNWVTEPDDIPFSTVEGPDASDPYVRNAYDWSYFNSGSVQDIGVTDAWNALAASGRDEKTITFATIDKGFGPNGDWPADRTHTGFRGENGRGNSASPWHGTHVMQTAAAIADNNFGVAGVAHQVVHPFNIHGGYDYFTSIGTVLGAAVGGADVINMSYSGDVPASVSFTVWPFEAVTVAVRAAGVLMFASAGNDGADVDNENCGPIGLICWESTWHTPCENLGVICVGGIDWDSKNRDPDSNFGSDNSGDTVDIYAPFTVFRGADPDNPGASVRNTISGTSFSSPFTAAVAALIWAADPTQSANQVESRLMSSAHPSPDAQVNRYVNAGDPVLDVIGTAVHADILSPSNGTSRGLGLPIGMSGEAGFVGAAGQPVSVTWSSNRDGQLATATETSTGESSIFSTETFPVLSVGSHTITLRVTAAGLVATDSITVTVTNTPPTPSIDQPTDGADVCSNRATNLRGSAIDTEDGLDIPGTSFSWESNRDGSLGTGKSVSPILSEGVHTIILSVVDAGGSGAVAVISVTSRPSSHPDCAGLAPTVSIISPENGDSEYADASDAGGAYREVRFTALVDDDTTGIADMVFTWTSSQDGTLTPMDELRLPGLAIPLPGGGSIEGIPTYYATLKVYSQGCGSTQNITLRATDLDGNNATDSLQLTTLELC